MKNKKLISRFGKILICSLLTASLNAGAQSTNQDQKNNAGTTNQQNNNINNPYTTIPADSVSRSNTNNGNSSLPENAQQQQQRVLHQSGQNQVPIPPNAAGPDTSIHRIPQDGNFNNKASDTTLQKNSRKRINNTTLTASPEKTSTGTRDTIK